VKNGNKKTTIISQNTESISYVSINIQFVYLYLYLFICEMVLGGVFSGVKRRYLCSRKIDCGSESQKTGRELFLGKNVK